VFDAAEPSFRHQADATYKAHRRRPAEGEDHPEHYLPAIRHHLGALGLQACAEAGVEADDVIASAAVEAAVLGLPVVIYSSDRDFLQIVSDTVHVQPPERNQPLYTPERVWERYQVHPYQFVDFKSLQGDPSDNLPGVPGIGPKTAARLLQEHGLVDHLLASTWLLPDRIAAALRTYEPRIRHNQAMIRLRTDLPLPFSLDDCQLDPATFHLNPFEAVRRAR
jgi:DNA polymerase-1